MNDVSSPTTVPGVTVAPGRWQRIKALLTGGLAPAQIGWAVGLGVAMGIAPIPGLQMAACTLIAWRLRLNIAIALFASNVSFGPLLIVWAALAVGIGRWIRLGEPPWRSWDDIVAGFHGAEQSFSAFLAAIGACAWDWVIGSLVLMPVLALLMGTLAFGCAHWWQRRRRRLRAVAPLSPE